jgi:hypothetical protein
MQSTNEIILACIDLMPIPGLKQVFDVYKKIWDTVKAMESMQEQLFTLSGALAHLLQTLDREHRTGRLALRNTAREIAKLDWSVVNSCFIEYQWLLTKIAQCLVCSKTP